MFATLFIKWTIWKDPQKNNIKHHHTHKQICFITRAALQTQPLQTNLRKLPVSSTLIILHAALLITTLTPVTQFFVTPTLGPRAPPTQTQSNPYHQDTISVGTTLLYNHPPTLHNTTARMISQLQKSNRIHKINFFFIRKNNKPRASIGQHSRSKWLSKEEETSLLGQNKNKSIITHKIQRWPQATKPITTNKNCNNQQGRSPTVPTTATCKNDKDC